MTEPFDFHSALKARREEIEREKQEKIIEWILTGCPAPNPPIKNEKKFIYIVKPKDSATGPVKIGITSRPIQRIRGIQTGYPRRLEFFAILKILNRKNEVRKCETEIHRKLKDYRTSGEWFDIEPDLALKVTILVLDSLQVHWSVNS